MYFLALSQAPPRAFTPAPGPISQLSSTTTTIGTSTGSSEGMIISLIAALVSMSTQVPYSGLALPSMMPAISLNWRRTSTTTEPAARPTASMPMAPNRYGTMPPMNRPMITAGSESENSTSLPACLSSWVQSANSTTAATPPGAMADRLAP